MLKIRLRRTGKRNQASYRIVVADSKKPRDGAFVDHLGHYNPRLDPPEVVIDEATARDWISKGSHPSEAVQRMLANLPSDETQEPHTESTDS